MSQCEDRVKSGWEWQVQGLRLRLHSARAIDWQRSKWAGSWDRDLEYQRPKCRYEKWETQVSHHNYLENFLKCRFPSSIHWDSDGERGSPERFWWCTFLLCECIHLSGDGWRRLHGSNGLETETLWRLTRRQEVFKSHIRCSGCECKKRNTLWRHILQEGQLTPWDLRNKGQLMFYKNEKLLFVTTNALWRKGILNPQLSLWDVLYQMKRSTGNGNGFRERAQQVRSARIWITWAEELINFQVISSQVVRGARGLS